MSWKLPDKIEPKFDGGLIDNKYVKAGLFVVKTKQQRNTTIKTLYRQLDGDTTTLCYVSAEGALYELIANPSTSGTTDQDWKKLDFGVSDILVAKGTWNADNTTPVLQDTDAAGAGNDFYVVTGAATPIQVQHTGLFGGQQVTVKDGDWVISNGVEWFVSSSPVAWDSLSGVPQTLLDYVAGTVIGHTHDISDVNNLQTELDTKFDSADVGSRTTAFGSLPDTKLMDVYLAITNFYQKSETYSQTEVDNLINGISVITTKGDLIAGNGSNVADRLGIGADNQILIADSAQPLGMRWGAAPTQGWALSGNTTLTGNAVVNSNGNTLEFQTGELSNGGFTITGDLNSDPDVVLFRFNHPATTDSITGATDIFLGPNNGGSATGYGNTVIGQNNLSGMSGTLSEFDGGRNVIIGYNIGNQFSSPGNNQGTHNVLLGRRVMYNSGMSSYAVAAGYEAMAGITGDPDEMQQIVALGVWAMQNFTYNSEVGTRTYNQNLIAIGTEALNGASALYDGLKSGTARGGIIGTIAIGSNAGEGSEIERYNIIIGDSAGDQSSIGRGNIFLGTFAGSNMVGASTGTTGDSPNNAFNVGVGVHAFEYGNGNKNTFVGVEAGRGSDNVNQRVTGEGNSGFGNWALNHVTGDNNTGLGRYAGYKAGATFLTGSRNLFVGYSAGYNEVFSSTFDDAVVMGIDYAPDVVSGNVYIGSKDGFVFASDHDGTEVQTTIDSLGNMAVPGNLTITGDLIFSGGSSGFWNDAGLTPISSNVTIRSEFIGTGFTPSPTIRIEAWQDNTPIDVYHKIDVGSSTLDIGSGPADQTVDKYLSFQQLFAKFYDTRGTTRGLEYNDDYSAGFQQYTLIDKNYGDNNYWTLSGASQNTVGASVGKLSGVNANDALYIGSNPQADSSYSYFGVGTPSVLANDRPGYAVMGAFRGTTGDQLVLSIDFDNENAFGAGAIFYDSRSTKAGIEYDATTASGAGFSVNSLISKSYADATYAPISGGAYWALTGTTTLTGNSTIAPDGNDLVFNMVHTGTSGGEFTINLQRSGTVGVNDYRVKFTADGFVSPRLVATNQAGGNEVGFYFADANGNPQVVFGDNRASGSRSGLEYSSDYGNLTAFGPRSLIDRGYWEADRSAKGQIHQANIPAGSPNYWATGADTVLTANVSISGGDVQLSAPLSGNDTTTISPAFILRGTSDVGGVDHNSDWKFESSPDSTSGAVTSMRISYRVDAGSWAERLRMEQSGQLVIEGSNGLKGIYFRDDKTQFIVGSANQINFSPHSGSSWFMYDNNTSDYFAGNVAGAPVLYNRAGSSTVPQYTAQGGQNDTGLAIDDTNHIIWLVENGAKVAEFQNAFVDLGNYQFDIDQVVGAGQDNYVLTFDWNGGTNPQIRLEAATGGGWAVTGTTNLTGAATILSDADAEDIIFHFTTAGGEFQMLNDVGTTRNRGRFTSQGFQIEASESDTFTTGAYAFFDVHYTTNRGNIDILVGNQSGTGFWAEIDGYGQAADAFLNMRIYSDASAEVAGITMDSNLGSGIVVRDDFDDIGFVYNADYSTAGELLDRWIPDKAWVVANAGGTLDTGYDFGGAGAGRIITVDSGAVELAYETPATNTVENLLTLTHTTSDVTTFGDAGLGSSIDFVATDGTAATTSTIGRISVYKDNGGGGNANSWIELNPFPGTGNPQIFRMGSSGIEFGDLNGVSSTDPKITFFGNSPTFIVESGDAITGADPAIRFTTGFNNGLIETGANRQAFLELSPEIDHTSFAVGYTALLIDVTPTNVIGTADYLIDAQVAGASKLSIDSSGNIRGAAGAFPYISMPTANDFYIYANSNNATIFEANGDTFGNIGDTDNNGGVPKIWRIASPDATNGTSVYDQSLLTVYRELNDSTAGTEIYKNIISTVVPTATNRWGNGVYLFVGRNNTTDVFYVDIDGQITSTYGGAVGGTAIHTLASTGDVELILDADTDDVTEDHNPKILLRQDGGVEKGRLELDANNNTVLRAVTNGDDLYLNTNLGVVYLNGTSASVDTSGNSTFNQVTTANGVYYNYQTAPGTPGALVAVAYLDTADESFKLKDDSGGVYRLDSRGSGSQSVAIGLNTDAPTQSVVIGDNALITAGNSRGVIIGYNAQQLSASANVGGVGIGYNIDITGDGVVVGAGGIGTSDASVVIGDQAGGTSSIGSISIGRGASNNGTGSKGAAHIAIGAFAGSGTRDANGIMIGNEAASSDPDGIAIGNDAVVNAVNAMMFGSGAGVTGTNSVPSSAGFRFGVGSRPAMWLAITGNATSTTSATEASMGNFAQTQGVYYYEIMIIGRQETSGGEYYAAKWAFVFKSQSGANALIGVQLLYEYKTSAGLSSRIGASGSTLNTYVTGLAATNMDWQTSGQMICMDDV